MELARNHLQNSNTFYKQTELGLIPSDWQLITFQETFDFLTTATYSRADLSENDETQYIHYGDIHTKWHHFLDFSKNILPTISSNKIKNYPLIKNGDIVMVDASEDYEGIGKSVEVKNLSSKKAISGLHTFLLRDSKGTFVNGFKGYIHSNKFVKIQFDRLATGLKVYSVSKNNLKTVLIPFPPAIEEQKAIAIALSDIDELIEGLETLIEKKRNIKQGAMQELLTGKTRLADFSGDWEVKKLSEIGFITTGYTPPTNDKTNYGEEYCFVSPVDLGKMKYISRSEKMLSKKGFSLSRKFPTNSILFTCIGSTIGKAGIAKEELTSNQQINAIFPNDSFSTDYLFYFLNLISKQIQSLAGEQAVPIINKTQFSQTLVSIPPTKEEQTAIAQILSEMDVEIDELEKRRDKYKDIKQGMMQELLTGKIRLI